MVKPFGVCGAGLFTLSSFAAGCFVVQQNLHDRTTIEHDMKSNTLVQFHAMLLAGALEMDPIVRRSTIGIASGLICSVALVATLHSLFSGVALGVPIGTLYAIAVRPTPFAYAESIFTAGARAAPLSSVPALIL